MLKNLSTKDTKEQEEDHEERIGALWRKVWGAEL